MATNDYIAKSMMQEHIEIFNMLTVTKGKNIYPNHEAFLGNQRQINGSKASLVVRMRNSLHSPRQAFLKRDFENLVKNTSPGISIAIEKIMDKLARKVKAIRDKDDLNSIGNLHEALIQIDRIAKRARNKEIPSALEAQATPTPATRRGQKAARPVNTGPMVVSPIFGMAHDRTQEPWNLHRKKMLYPVHIDVIFDHEDGYIRGNRGTFTAYLPYGLQLIDAVCVVEYETRGCSVEQCYITFPRNICKVGKAHAVKKGNFYATAQSFRYMEKQRRVRPFNPDDYEDPSEALLTALDNRMLPPGHELSHHWELPDAYSKTFFFGRDRSDIVRNNVNAIEAGKIANAWFTESTGVFTGVGTYSIRFQEGGNYRATLTNLDMLSYKASEAYFTRDPLPSSIAFRTTPSTHRGILVRNRNRRLEHVFNCKVNGRCTQWEPLWDGLCLITDDVNGVYAVSVRYNEDGALHDNADGVVATPIVIANNGVREIGEFTVIRVRTANGHFLAFIPTQEIKRFSSIYSEAASNLVARVNKIVDGYSYIDAQARSDLNTLVSQRVELAYRQYANDATAAAALVNTALGCYNGIFSPSAREFIQEMTPDFISVLSSSQNFMRDSMLRVTNRKLALTVAVGVSTGIATYSIGRDLSTISQLHPIFGNALAYMVRGGLEEAWLMSVSWANPGLGTALRLMVAATEFVRDVSGGIAPYSAAIHSAAAFVPSWVSVPLHVIYNGARGYLDAFGSGQATLNPLLRVAAVACIGLIALYVRNNKKPENDPAPLAPGLQEGEDEVDERVNLSELFKPAPQHRDPPGVSAVPVLQKALVGDVNEALSKSGVEVAIAEVTLPWVPLLKNNQLGDTLQVNRDEVVSNEEDLLNFGCQRSSTWLCWGGSRQRLPFHFGNSLVNLIGGVYRRLLVPAMRVVGPHNTPIAWTPPRDFSLNEGLGQLISSSVRVFNDSQQYWFEDWVNSRTAAQSRKYSDELRNSPFERILARAKAQLSYKVKFFVKQEPTFNPSIRLIFPIEPLAEMAISPFVRCMEQRIVHEMRSRMDNPRNRQSIFTGGFDSLEKGKAWNVIKSHFEVNYVFAVDCTSWDSFVPGELLASYRRLYPDCISTVVDRQLIRPSHYEAGKNGQYYLKANRHTCSQLSGSPDTYIMNSIANSHILESFMEEHALDGQAMICGDDSLLTVRTSRPLQISESLVEHFKTFGLTAKVAHFDINDARVDYCSGHFVPVTLIEHGFHSPSYAWIPNPIKFVSKAFLIKTISKEDIDSAQSRYLMSAYQMFKYAPDLLKALVPRRLRDSLSAFRHVFPDLDYELQLKYGGFVTDDRWRLSAQRHERDLFETLCLCGDYDAVFESSSMFFTADFERELLDMESPTLMPDTRAKYEANVLQYQEVVPPVYHGKLTYASLLACNPVFQLALGEMDDDIIRARKFLERSPYHVTLLNSNETQHLRLHMAFTNRTDLFMRINSVATPRVFVNPSHYLNSLSDLGAREVMRMVSRHVQAAEVEYEAPTQEEQAPRPVPVRTRTDARETAAPTRGVPRSKERDESKTRVNKKATTEVKPTEIVIRTRETRGSGSPSERVKEGTATRNAKREKERAEALLQTTPTSSREERLSEKPRDRDMVGKREQTEQPKMAEPKGGELRAIGSKPRSRLLEALGKDTKVPAIPDLQVMLAEAREWGKQIRGNVNVLLREGEPKTLEEARTLVHAFSEEAGYARAYHELAKKCQNPPRLASEEFKTRLETYNPKNKVQRGRAELYMQAFTEIERATLSKPLKEPQAEGVRITPVERDSVSRREEPPHTVINPPKVKINIPTKETISAITRTREPETTKTTPPVESQPVGREYPVNSLEGNVKK